MMESAWTSHLHVDSVDKYLTFTLVFGGILACAEVFAIRKETKELVLVSSYTCSDTDVDAVNDLWESIISPKVEAMGYRLFSTDTNWEVSAVGLLDKHPTLREFFDGYVF